MILEEKQFKGVINDRNFKVFFKLDNTLKDFLNSYFKFLNINHSIVHVSHTLQAIIPSNNISYKDFYADILATLDNGEIILLEMFSNFSANEFKKSYNYLARVYSNQVKFREKNYLKAKKCTCLNLMSGNYKSKNFDIVNRYVNKNINTNEMLDTSELEMVLIRLDLSQKDVYSKSNKRFIKWLKLINAKSFEEMESIAGGDKIMQDSIDYLKWYHENLDHGYQDIIDEEVYEARKNERKETKLDIAKNMLKKGFCIIDIKEMTGLSEKQIKKLEEEL